MNRNGAHMILARKYFANQPTVREDASLVSGERKVDRRCCCCHRNVDNPHAVVQLEAWVMWRLEKLASAGGVVHRWNENAMLEVADRRVTKAFGQYLAQPSGSMLRLPPETECTAGPAALTKNTTPLVLEQHLELWRRNVGREPKGQQAAGRRATDEVKVRRDGSSHRRLELGQHRGGVEAAVAPTRQRENVKVRGVGHISPSAGTDRGRGCRGFGSFRPRRG